MIKYYDIGLNLFCRQFRDYDKIIKDASEEGVYCILTGSSMKSNESIDKYVNNHDCVGTCGIHPHSADRAKTKDFERMKEIISKNDRIVAVGECGLDYDRMFSTKENQISCLERHIKLAEELDKPLFLHERSSTDDFIDIFKKHPNICRRSVVHCFTGDKATIKKYLDMGFYIGITGWICDNRRSSELREAVKLIPLDRIMVETDAPYLTPRNVKGLNKINVPQNIKYVVSELAKYMSVDPEILRISALENTKKFFGI